MKTILMLFVLLGLPLMMLSMSCRTSERSERMTETDDTMWSRPSEVQTPPEPNQAMQHVLDELAALGGKPIATLTAEEARKQPTPADAVKKLLEKQGKSTAPEPVGNVENRNIPGPDGEVPVRIFTPNGEGPFPVVLYIHGGGWVIATNDTYESSMRAICNGAASVVVSPEYRKGPEAKFPAAHEDTFAAYKWVVQNAGQIKGDARRIAVVGESAGGNMAAVIALRARSEGVKPPMHQVLIYPVAGHDFNTPSYQRNANAKPLNKAMMQWFFDKYLNTPAEGDKPWISLLKAERVEGVAPATIITAEIDPLMSEGKAYADKLKAAGVDVVYKNFDGVAHEFFGMGAVLPEAKEAVKIATDRLKAAFAR